MTLYVGVGQAYTFEGRDAVTEAIHGAMAELDNQKISLAMIFASNEYDIQGVLNGAVTQLGNTPLIGFSTSGEMTSVGSHRRSVVVVLLGGDEIESRTEWISDFAENSPRATDKLIQSLGLEKGEGLLFIVADGLNGDGGVVAQNLSLPNFQVAGCLAGGDLRTGRTFQIGGNQAGTGGLAAAVIEGDNLRLGVGTGHGWEPVGAFFNVTRARGPWVRTLDGKPASESYAELFGRRARDWAFPPLNTLVRLYPLGIEQGDDQPLLVRTPLKIEADGSLRMNTAIKDGSVGHLLVGRTEGCLEAARQAARDALKALGQAKPKLALVFADISWEMLLKGQPGSEIQAIQEVLGKDIPIAGGYTFGQLASVNGSNKLSLLNQHIEVVLIGENELN